MLMPKGGLAKLPLRPFAHFGDDGDPARNFCSTHGRASLGILPMVLL